MLISVIAHEVAHGLVTGPTSTLKRVLILMPLGGVTLSDENLMQQKDPVRQVPCGHRRPAHEPDPGAVCVERDQVRFAATHIFVEPFIYAGNLPGTFVIVNLFLAAIHLLPAYPTDGGRVLRAEMAKRMNPVLATRKAVSIGQLFATALLFSGLWNPWLMVADSCCFCRRCWKSARWYSNPYWKA